MSIEALRTALADRYRIERKLGEGGMATVYLATDLKHDRQVAIKVLKPDLAAVLGAERFLAEIKTTANLRHPHILPLYDSGAVGRSRVEGPGSSVEGVVGLGPRPSTLDPQPSTLYYVMPFVEGESLRDRLDRDKQLPIDEALQISREVADALGYAHGRGIIHRDIKPENILLENGHAVVADFGIARAISSAGGERITQTGIAVGTPVYMSPEQAAGSRDLDGRSDLYSLACVLYEMLAGDPPFTGATAAVITRQHMIAEAAPVTNKRPAVPDHIAGSLSRALAKDPADRFNPVAQFTQALTAIPTAPARSDAVPDRTARSPRRRWVVLAGGGALLLAAAGYLLTRSRSAGGAAEGVIHSIAVMPLDNYSADSTQAYFAEGMTDELTTDLAGISSLRVISRGSVMQYQGKNRPPSPEIAKALNVDAIVEGSVTRAGDKVRITAQLIDARADKHLWAQSFERQSSDVLALQADLASAIAEAIKVRITPAEQTRLAAAPTIDPVAHDAYLRGRFFFNRPTEPNLQKAIAEFSTAAERSPTFAPAYSGLSDAYTWAAYNEGFIRAVDAKPLARAAAERAVALDSMSAEAHTSLGVYRAWLEYDWNGGERELRRAIALNPSYAYAHDQLNQLLGIVGRFDEAIAEGRRAAELDPLSPSILDDLATTMMYAGRPADAVGLMEKSAELDPTYFFPPATAGLLALQTGDARSAIPKFERALALGAPPFTNAYLAYAYAKTGDRTRANAALEALRTASPGHDVAPFNLALVYLGLGDSGRALDYLEQAYAANSEMLVWLKVDHMFDPLRQNPRFIALMQKMRFIP